MEHEFELAFNLLDEAAGRIQHQQYGINRIPFHSHGDVLLTAVHTYTRATGHHIVVFAADDHGQLVAVEATAADLDAAPSARIVKVRIGELTFHASPPQPWTFRARHHTHSYTLTAGVGSQPMWTITIDEAPLAHYDDLNAALRAIWHHQAAIAA
ncbi:hypothetical protein [Mycobacterium sp. 1423905.2]|uniref:hypothetical protein n=1 Tax=Mycobacterium sp. 1423905.2 TaxID=1856859 RepID=UPI0007FC907D|nr:hypothetical protein [Mycobacterium sp. 1423905.2]OBJ52293.1 hypothetical protein A9W95_20465 [Mycobacterium sp. 1423905.2]